MKKFVFILMTALVILPLSGHAADTTPQAYKAGLDLVKAFYGLLTNTEGESDADFAARAASVVDPNWVSIPASLAGDGLNGFVSTFTQYHQAIPDMKWTPVEILKSGSNRYIARCTGTGTPVFDFLHLGSGFKPRSSFKITTIDIHTVKNGKITKTYHVEDWATAMAQLQGL